MNDLPFLLQDEEYETSEGDRNSKKRKRTLLLVLTSTFGKGYLSSTASAFMSRTKKIENEE